MSKAKLPNASSMQAGEFSESRAMLVEDCEPVSRALSRLLSYIGFQVAVFPTADGAGAWLRDSPALNLLVADFALPGGANGADLARVARARCADLPVICISGYHTDILAAYPDLVGPRTRVLMKPIQSQALVAAIRDVMPPARPLPRACGA